MQNKPVNGFEHWYELYLLNDSLDAAAWTGIIAGISQYIGTMKTWKLVMTMENNIVRYFVGTAKDIGMLSNNLDNVVLRPIAPESLVMPTAQGKERFVSYVNGGNILDLRENTRLNVRKNYMLLSSRFAS